MCWMLFVWFISHSNLSIRSFQVMNQRFREASSPDLCGSKAWLSSALNTNVNIGPLLRSGHSQHPASSHCHCLPKPLHQPLLGLSTSTHAPLSLPYPSHSILYIASEWSFKTVITSPLCLEPSNGFFFAIAITSAAPTKAYKGCVLWHLPTSLIPFLPCPVPHLLCSSSLGLFVYPSKVHTGSCLRASSAWAAPAPYCGMMDLPIVQAWFKYCFLSRVFPEHCI